VLERVNGELADLLTGRSGGERVLQDLEEAGAFVVSLDAARSWFRYHRLFAGLLQLELRRTESGEVPRLHAAAASWFAEHGFPVEAIRHAQAAEDWGLAARLLADYWLGLVLDGQAAAGRDMLVRFPPGLVAADAELTGLMASGELVRGSLQEAEGYLARATAGSASVPADQRARFETRLAVLRIWLAQQRGDLGAVAEQAERFLAPVETFDAARLGLGEDLRALALVSLGVAEIWSFRGEEAERHLEQGVALARRIGRAHLELVGLTHLVTLVSSRDVARQTQERSMRAIELARQHGWGEEPVVAIAYVMLAASLSWQGRLDEAQQWHGHAERVLRAGAEPTTEMLVHEGRGVLAFARGRDADALAAFRAALQLAGRVVAAHRLTTEIRGFLVHTLVRMGEIAQAEQALGELSDLQRDSAGIRTATAALRLAQGTPQAAADALAPVLDGSAPGPHPGWLITAFLLEAVAQDALGDPAASGSALERALDLAEPDGLVSPFLLHPTPQLLERHSRQHTTHAALILQLRTLLAGANPPLRGEPRPLAEPLSDSEARVLRYLPSNLTAPEIAAELSLSVHTVKTHMRHLYAKLGTHTRAEAVERARTLGLLAPAYAR